MSGLDDWNDVSEENKTKILGFIENKKEGNASDPEIENLLKSYVDSEVDVTKVLCEFLNFDDENFDDNNEVKETKDSTKNIQVLENDLMKLQIGVDRLYELLDFDLDLIINDQLIDMDKGFVEKYMHALQLLDSVDDKIREDFISLRQTSVADIHILHTQWELPIKEATQFIEKHLDEMEQMINDIARKHIDIGVRVRKCIILKSKNRPEYENLVKYLKLDNGAIKKKKETLSTGKVGPVGKSNRTTEQSFIVPDEDEKVEELHITERPTRRIVGPRKIKKQDCPRAADSSQLPNPFAIDDQTTRKIEQISLSDLTA